MQDQHPLTLHQILERMRSFHGEAVCASVTHEGVDHMRYADVADRIDRVAAGLQQFGVCPGDRVATLAWNTREHLEVYIAAPCIGAVLHTINARLSGDQIVQIVAHAEDRVLFVDRSLAGLVEAERGRMPSIEQVIVFDAEESGAPRRDPLRGVCRQRELGA